MSKPKKHWAATVPARPTLGKLRFRLACWRFAWIGSANESGPLWIECSASVFRDLSVANPDWYCTDCAKTARLALAKESAQKPAEVSERPNCGDKRTDSERYAELRQLVEEWQSHITGSSQALADWSHR